MKRLIVFTALLTLLASLSGCSMICGRRESSCDRPAVPTFRLPNFSLPWNRTPCEPAGCSTCENGTVMGGATPSGMGGATPSGVTVGGSPITVGPIQSSSGYTPYSSGRVITEELYDPGQVFDGAVIQGPVYAAPTRNVEGLPSPVPGPEFGGVN